MKSIYILLFALTAFSFVKAQDDKESPIKDQVLNRTFVFKAQTVIPATGPSRQLTSDYDVRVTPESIVTYLPYFGRAYSAPIDPSNAGFNFTSKEYDYKVKDRKKGGWDVQIKPKDVTDIRNMNFTIFPNGNASLQVSSNSKQTISFNGVIQNSN